MSVRALDGAAVLALALTTAVGACDENGSTGPEDGSMVAVAFRAGASSSASPAGPAASAEVAQAGTLELDGVWLVVDEFKLEGNDGACEVPDPVPDCAKFEAEPHLLAVPLVEGETETVLEEVAPPGAFTRLKFETKAVTGNADVESAIEAEGISDWPGPASLLVTGAFTPEGTLESEPFRVFFDAEVKVVLPLPDPLVVAEEGPEAQAIFIEVAPDTWFLGEGGGPLDLGALDYDLTGQVHPLEVKLEDGFTKIEVGG